MRIIGIDPGTATTGFSILDENQGKLKLIDYGCIRTPAGLDASIRLNQIAQDLQTLIDKWSPEIASVEKLYANKNVKTVIQVAQARGVIIQKLMEMGIQQKHFTPPEIKSSICGYGRADKKMVMRMVKMILKLQETPKPDDAADAIAAAICLANSYRLIQTA